jgi:hypothetical protein
MAGVVVEPLARQQVVEQDQGPEFPLGLIAEVRGEPGDRLRPLPEIVEAGPGIGGRVPSLDFSQGIGASGL